MAMHGHPQTRVRALAADTALVVTLLGFAGILLLSSPFRLAWPPERAILLAVIILGALRLFYTSVRPNAGIALMATLGCFLVLFTDAVAIIDYVLVGLWPLPLQDARLSAADAALGLDWMSLYRFTSASQWFNRASNIAYNLLGPELILLLLLLVGLGQARQAVLLWRRFAVTALVTVGLGLLIPAAGPFAFHHLPVAASTGYVVQYAALRDGSLRLIDLAHAEGLVSFPSFHACLTVVCAAGARGLGPARFVFYLLNLLIVIASPMIGGHYFVDIFAGLLLGGLASLARAARAG
jgi:hypothetical protein